MRKIVLFIALVCSAFVSCRGGDGSDGSVDPEAPVKTVDVRNLERAMTLSDAAFSHYFDLTDGMKMSRYYNPFTRQKSSEIGSIWMYTASLEAVLAIMETLQAQKDAGHHDVYSQKFEHYKSLLDRLFEGARYYKGTYQLVSYTQTASWSVYAVNRAVSPGAADVTGRLNVYDDQMWLIRELLKAYSLTGAAKFLMEAEYLTAYVLDGWDCTLDAEGRENGGITWGPGYVTKHACSNGPMVSPLVWLSELYRDMPDEISVGAVLPDGTRIRKSVQKGECYLAYAEKIYSYQKQHLLRPADGVYDDMMGGYRTGGGNVEYETIDGQTYRKHTALYDRVGPAISYNSGTMLSGAADLYRVTRKAEYLTDLAALSDRSFAYFAKLGQNFEGYYSYDITGFRNWFNNVLMRGYVDVHPFHEAASTAIGSFQRNLDYAWEHFLQEDMLPTSLLGGWNLDRSKNNVEAMFTFAFAAEYAVLARYSIDNKLIN